MDRLPIKFTKYRYQFEQLCRNERAAIYVQHMGGRAKTYEVIVIRIADRKPVKVGGAIKWVACPPYECYPSSDSWGLCGFTYTCEADARAKYDILSDPAYDFPAPPLYPIRPRARDGILAERV